jgi:hypothetical protein
MENIILNVVLNIISGLVSMLGYDKVIKPSLKVSDFWVRRKWVYKLEKKNNFSYIDMKVDNLNISNTIRNGDISAISSTSTEGFDEWNVKEKEYYDFFGVAIKNLEPSFSWIPRKKVDVFKTKLTLDDGKIIECRWWSKDYADEGEKLLEGENSNLEERRRKVIACGDFEYLVLAYRVSNGREFSLFDIASDVKDNIWKKKHIFGKFPRYANLDIFTSENKMNIKIKIDLSKDNKYNLEFSEITHFPELVLLNV